MSDLRSSFSFSVRLAKAGLSALLLAGILATVSLSPALAAEPHSNTLPELTGLTLKDKRLSLRDFRDRVVLVVYWSTNCPVCRDNMRELRANLSGWDNQPFTLLGVNLDEKRNEFHRYESIVDNIVKPEQRFVSVWGLDPSYKDTLGMIDRLPSSVLINKQGKVVQRYKGRIPPSAWDDIAEAL